MIPESATPEIDTLSLHDALPICGGARAVAQALLPSLGSGAGRSRLPGNGGPLRGGPPFPGRDRKSTRLNSSHANISYAVFCLKKKNAHHLHLGTSVDGSLR